MKMKIKLFYKFFLYKVSYENLCDTLVYGKESLYLDFILFLLANVGC